LLDPPAILVRNTKIAMSSSRSLFALACVGCLEAGHAWSQSASAPAVEVSLGAPEHALSEITNEIGLLETTRENFESEMMHRVQAAANAAVLEADASIAHALAKITHRGQLRSRATSFLATKAMDKRRVSSFKVHVPLVDVPGSGAGASIRALEQASADNERHMFDQAINDMRALPGSVAEQLEDLVRQRLGQLRAPPSFLEESRQGSRALADEGNIRVVATKQTAPSVQSLVAAMQHRRSMSETLTSYKIVSIKLEALQAMNAKVQQVLSKVATNSAAAFLGVRSHAQGARGKTSTSTGQSDFEVFVHPPEETTDEISESLDATMKAENAKLSAALGEFAKEKQDLVNLEKQELRDIVRQSASRA